MHAAGLFIIPEEEVEEVLFEEMPARGTPGLAGECAVLRNKLRQLQTAALRTSHGQDEDVPEIPRINAGHRQKPMRVQRALDVPPQTQMEVGQAFMEKEASTTDELDQCSDLRRSKATTPIAKEFVKSLLDLSVELEAKSVNSAVATHRESEAATGPRLATPQELDRGLDPKLAKEEAATRRGLMTPQSPSSETSTREPSSDSDMQEASAQWPSSDSDSQAVSAHTASSDSDSSEVHAQRRDKANSCLRTEASRVKTSVLQKKSVTWRDLKKSASRRKSMTRSRTILAAGLDMVAPQLPVQTELLAGLELDDAGADATATPTATSRDRRPSSRRSSKRASALDPGDAVQVRGIDGSSSSGTVVVVDHAQGSYKIRLSNGYVRWFEAGRVELQHSSD